MFTCRLSIKDSSVRIETNPDKTGIEVRHPIKVRRIRRVIATFIVTFVTSD